MRGDEEWVGEESREKQERGVGAAAVMALHTYWCVCVCVFVKSTCEGGFWALVVFFYSFMAVFTSGSFTA